MEGATPIAVGDVSDTKGPPFTLTCQLVRDLLTPHGFEEMLMVEVPEEKALRGPLRENTTSYFARFRKL